MDLWAYRNGVFFSASINSAASRSVWVRGVDE
jgi:hypothetical protein